MGTLAKCWQDEATGVVYVRMRPYDPDKQLPPGVDREITFTTEEFEAVFAAMTPLAKQRVILNDRDGRQIAEQSTGSDGTSTAIAPAGE